MSNETTVAAPATKRLTLEVATARNPGGFAGYFAGTAKKGKARIFVNVDAMAWAAAEHGERGDFKRTFIDSLAHEFIHALEDSFGLLFDEDAVEASIEAVRKSEAVSHSASADKPGREQALEAALRELVEQMKGQRDYQLNNAHPEEYAAVEQAEALLSARTTPEGSTR